MWCDRRGMAVPGDGAQCVACNNLIFYFWVLLHAAVVVAEREIHTTRWYIYACAQNPHIYIYICSYIHIFLASMYLPTSYMYLHSSRSVHTWHTKKYTSPMTRGVWCKGPLMTRRSVPTRRETSDLIVFFCLPDLGVFEHISRVWCANPEEPIASCFQDLGIWNTHHLDGTFTAKG